MARLFVDCDDTLVLWELVALPAGTLLASGPNPYGNGTTGRWRFNQDLVRAIEFDRDWDLVVWSGGGLEYARRWRDLLGWDQALALTKNLEHVTARDLVVDDQPLRRCPAPVMTWQDYVAEARHAGWDGSGREVGRGTISMYYAQLEENP